MCVLSGKILLEILINGILSVEIMTLLTWFPRDSKGVSQSIAQASTHG